MKLLTLPISYLLITLISCGLIFATTLAQNTSEAWDNGDESVTFLETRQFTSREVLRANLGVHTNTACAQATILIGLSQESARDCWYNSPLGKHSTYGNYFVPNGSSTVSLVGIDVQTRFIPLYGNTHLLVLRPSVDGGFSMNFYRYGAFEASIVRAEDGYQFYDITTEPDFLLRTSSGNPWLINQNTLATGFWPSNNGRFLVIANYTDGILLRLDLATYELTSFGYERNGLDYGTYAITDDGRWVAISVHGEPLSLLDAHSCRQSPARLGSELRLCSVHDYTMTLSAALPGSGGRMYHVRFTADHILELHSNEYTSAGFEKFLLYAPGTYEFGTNYLALGDSYASGEGARQYYAGTDVETNRCHLSRVSYPFLLGQQLELSSANSVACSGAKIQNIITRDDNPIIDSSWSNPLRANQYDTEQDDIELGFYLPGQGLQIEKLSELDIDIVTISISGNDADFGNFISDCVFPKDCYPTDIERINLIRKITDLHSRLVEVYTTLRASLSPDARVYALSYPQLVSNRQRCSGTEAWMSNNERELTIRLTNYLNRTIEIAAQNAGVTYVDISDALEGYNLCYPTTDSSMHGVNLGFSRAHNYWLFSQESFHPTAFGHTLIAQSIREQTNDFTILNPRPVLTPKLSLIDAVDFGIITDQTVAEYYTDAIYYAAFYDGEIILRGEMVQGVIVDYSSRYYDFAPNSPFVIQLYSDPVTLGTFMTDSMGQLSYDFTIPDEVEAGFHRIRAFGTNRAGEPIELRQVVYIAASEEDWDGDGRLNSAQPCLISLQLEDSTLNDYWCSDPQEPRIIAEPTTQEAPEITYTPPLALHDSVQIQNQMTAGTTGADYVLMSATPQATAVQDFAIQVPGAPDNQAPDSSDNRWAWLIALAVVLLIIVCYRYAQKRSNT